MPRLETQLSQTPLLSSRPPATRHLSPFATTAFVASADRLKLRSRHRRTWHSSFMRRQRNFPKLSPHTGPPIGSRARTQIYARSEPSSPRAPLHSPLHGPLHKPLGSQPPPANNKVKELSKNTIVFTSLSPPPRETPIPPPPPPPPPVVNCSRRLLKVRFA